MNTDPNLPLVTPTSSSSCCGGASKSSAPATTAAKSSCCGGSASANTETSATKSSCCSSTPSTTLATAAVTSDCGCGSTSIKNDASATSSCCSTTMPAAPTAAESLVPAADPRSLVREKYGEVASGTCVGVGCCGAAPDDEAALAAFGYTAEQRAAIPEGANLGLGCGNPIAHAKLQKGETVLDLGSGGGIDCFLAAREVGATGRVIGVDMTPAMIERARANRVRIDATNVEFCLGEIEHLPVADATVDVIISNCVVNLSPDKKQVFREALRVLKPGGRLVVSDLVLLHELSPELQRNVDLYVGCIAGASLKEDYLQLMRDAGFADVRVVEEIGYTVGMERLEEGSPERDAFRAVTSVKVWALKR